MKLILLSSIIVSKKVCQGLLIFFLVLVTLAPLNAQTFNGGVMDNESNKIYRAKISYSLSTETTKTSFKGLFEISFSTHNQDTLIIEARGFLKKSIPAKKFSSGNIAVIYLEKDPNYKKRRYWFWFKD